MIPGPAKTVLAVPFVDMYPEIFRAGDSVHQIEPMSKLFHIYDDFLSNNRFEAYCENVKTSN